MTVTAAPATFVCEINETSYATLTNALATMPSRDTAFIKLLKDINHTTYIHINNKNITFQLDGYDLTVDTRTSGTDTLGVINGGSVNYTNITGNGESNIIGAKSGVSAHYPGSTATVTHATSTGYNGDAVRASFGGAVTVDGDVVYSGDSGNDDGYGYGSVLAYPVSVVTFTGATLSGFVSSDGGALVTECGFVYGTSANPTTGGTKIADGTRTDNFTGTFEGAEKKHVQDGLQRMSNRSGKAAGRNASALHEHTAAR